MNLFVGIGNLTKAPELRYLADGKGVATFTLAIQRRFKREEADFINCAVFGPVAEHVAKLDKGKKLGIEGRLQIRSYDGNDGQKKWVTEIICDQVEFLSPKDSVPMPDNLGTNVNFDDGEIPF